MLSALFQLGSSRLPISGIPIMSVLQAGQLLQCEARFQCKGG